MPSASFAADLDASFHRAEQQETLFSSTTRSDYALQTNNNNNNSLGLEVVNSTEAFPLSRPKRISSMGELEPASLVDFNSSLERIGDEQQAPPAASANKGQLSSCPFLLLAGESVSHWGKVAGGTLHLTNYRLFFQLDNHRGFYNVPIGCVDSVENRDGFWLHIVCKDTRILQKSSNQFLRSASTPRTYFPNIFDKIGCDTNEKRLLWYKQLANQCVAPRPSVERLFAFAFRAWSSAAVGSVVGLRLSRAVAADIWPTDFRRCAFDESIWRVSLVNEKFELCETYPRRLVVPRCIDDDQLKKFAEARSLRRLPVAVWRDKRRGAVLLRSSQLSLGILHSFGWRSNNDEPLLKAYMEASIKPLAKPGLSNSSISLDNLMSMLILDARSYTAALANRFKGGGLESSECYQRCEVLFMGLANIHNIRYSFSQLRQLVQVQTADQTNFLQNLQATNWLQYMSSLLTSSLRVVEALLDEGRSVLVHCSDGWDRTSQIVSLAKLVVEPHYRTLQGFKELIEREWVEFGHKFADRCGLLNGDPNERSPVFVQWLDCVHQLLLQFPCAFEFNQLYLVKLAQHVYTGLFGTFLCNSASEAARCRLRERTLSVWRYLNSEENPQFRNVLFVRYKRPLRPRCQVQDLALWEAVYRANQQPAGAKQSVHRLGSSQSLTSLGSAAGAGAAVHVAPVAATLKSERTLPSRTHSCESLRSSDRVVGVSFAMSRDVVAGPLMTSSVAMGRWGSEADLPLTPLVNSDNKHVESNTAGQESEADVSGVLEDMVKRVSFCDVDEAGDDLTPLAAASNCVDGSAAEECAHCSSFYVLGRRCNEETVRAEVPVVNGNAAVFVCQNGVGVDQMKTSTTEISDSLVSRTSWRRAQRRCSAGRERERRRRWLEKELTGELNRHSVADWLDFDGLTVTTNVEEERMRELLEEAAEQRDVLETELQRLRLQLREKRYGCRQEVVTNGGGIAIPGRHVDGVESGEAIASSVDSLGARSDISWEAVEEKDTRPTCWIPDHAVTNCMGCDNSFQFYNRKHHCRKCGKVFCSACSSYESSLPDEQLYQPVRVCNTCFCALTDVKTLVVVNGANNNDSHF